VRLDRNEPVERGASDPPVRAMPVMRLVSYNILDGGEGRADPLAEVILAQRPDVVALVEADNLEVVERIASRSNMDFIHAPGPKVEAAALLSRWPIARTINHALLRGRTPSPGTPGEGRGEGLEKSFLEADVIDPAGATWTIGVAHLHARAFEEDEQRREREIQIVLDTFAEHRRAGHPHLLVGDFNSNAPYQQINPDECKPKTREAWEQNGGRIPRRVVRRLLDAGYIDTLHAFDRKAGETLGSFSTQYPGQRVDYIFGFGFDRRAVKDAWIEHDRLAKYASDHFPIGVQIN
jgi:endonuclease/exonuclease/phosphatase family metal-dependent hydrolase